MRAAEREQPILLPDDPRRRPSDVFIPVWPGGQGIAMDFAATSPFQLASVRGSSGRKLAAAVAYEDVKFSDCDTARRCRDHGVRLVPMVAESLGGWGPEAQKVLKTSACALNASSGASHGLVVAKLYEGLGVQLMRAPARSSLARVTRAATTSFWATTARAETECSTPIGS